MPTIQPELSGDFAILMGWADAIRGMGVRANAETALDARMARRFGAEGIGLSRTEHMFFQADRIGAMRRVIMAEDETGRRAGLAELLPMQREDFAEIFRIMKGFPVTIRLLDPPLHEFLPKTEEEFNEIERLTGKDVSAIRHRALALHEVNPMLGHRGCRLGITYPEIYEMQATAIFEAAISASSSKERPLINNATVNPMPAKIPTPAIPDQVRPSAISAIFERTARKENKTIPNTFPSIRPRNTPSAIGLEIASFSCSADRATPALANANKGRIRKHTQGWMPLSSRSAMESVARSSRSNSVSVASADDLSLLKI